MENLNWDGWEAELQKSISAREEFFKAREKPIGSISNDGKWKKVRLGSDGWDRVKKGASVSPKEDPKKEEAITLDTFKKIASESNSVEEFTKEVRKIKTVPHEVALEFFTKYRKDGASTLSADQAAKKFYDEYKTKETPKVEAPKLHGLTEEEHLKNSEKYTKESEELLNSSSMPSSSETPKKGTKEYETAKKQMELADKAQFHHSSFLKLKNDRIKTPKVEPKKEIYKI